MGARQGKLTLSQTSAIARKTRFSSDEITTWHAEFMRDCPRGLLSRDEFKVIFQEIFPFGKSDLFADHVFNVFDRSSDNNLTFTEYIQALSATGRGSIDEKLGFAFRLFDLNRDGVIHRDEMIQVIRSINLMIGGGNGGDDDEGPEEKASRIFASFKKLDGGLTETEFLDGARNNPTIYRSLTLYTGLV